MQIVSIGDNLHEVSDLIFYGKKKEKKKEKKEYHQFVVCWFCSFVCVEVLRPSQPNGVMSSAVSLPNHTFTGQA